MQDVRSCQRLYLLLTDLFFSPILLGAWITDHDSGRPRSQLPWGLSRRRFESLAHSDPFLDMHRRGGSSSRLER